MRWATQLDFTYVYLARHLIENFFARFKQDPCIATRFDQTARNVLGAVFGLN
jgi:hypothetical protein